MDAAATNTAIIDASAPVTAPRRRWLRLPGTAGSREIDVSVDGRGRLSNADGAFMGPPARDGDKEVGRVRLHLAPGLCSLRRLAVEGLKRKDVDAALLLWAEESLAAPLDDYYVDSWSISPGVRGIAAVRRPPLQRARAQLHQWGYGVVALQVPELRPPRDARPGVVVWYTPFGVTACVWQNRTLVDWHTFPADLGTRALGELLRSRLDDTPQWVLANHASGASHESKLDYERLWPGIDASELSTMDYRKADKWLGAGPAFGYVDEESRQPAAAEDRLRLAFSLAALAAAGFVWFYAEVVQLEREVAQREHTTSLLKVQANRSQQLAIRIGSNLNEIRRLREMTIERDGVMRVLQAVSDVLPPRLRLASISMERGGLVALDGVAEAEVDVSRLLEQLGQLAMFESPTLTFTQKDDKQEPPIIRFRVEARMPVPLLILPGNEQDDDEIDVPASSTPATEPASASQDGEGTTG